MSDRKVFRERRPTDSPPRWGDVTDERGIPSSLNVGIEKEFWGPQG
jgi:hypothetical protein